MQYEEIKKFHYKRNKKVSLYVLYTQNLEIVKYYRTKALRKGISTNLRKRTRMYLANDEELEKTSLNSQRSQSLRSPFVLPSLPLKLDT